MTTAADVRAALARTPPASRLAPVRGDDWLQAGFESERASRRFDTDPRTAHSGAF